ncbi:hypothetical protein [Pseudomonas sp.]|nr:hypothetical protein [Pseudomonas sp.]
MKLMEWRDHGQSTAAQPLPQRRSSLREGLILLSMTDVEEGACVDQWWRP